MFSQFKIFNTKKSITKAIFFLPLICFLFTQYNPNPLKALEFQWNPENNYKKLRWHQKQSKKRSRNTIFFFLRPSDRQTGLLKINLKLPEKFKKVVNPEKVSLCKVSIGGFEGRTKCIEKINADIGFSEDKTKLDIFPLKAIPSSEDSYAVVLKVVNPQGAGLYQFHSFGQSSGKVPVSYYIGSWTIKIDQQ